MGRSSAARLAAVLLAVSACNDTSTFSPPSTTGNATQTPAIVEATPIPPSPSPSPSTPGAALASGAALPACEPTAPVASATVTFVAAGHAWALNPSGADLTCLFEVADPRPFDWGPLGDRALIGGLEVKGVGSGPSLAASDQAFATIEWSRPTGRSIVYVPPDGASLKKVHIDGTSSEDVTPLPSATYLSIAYHPSGEAFAFAVKRFRTESIWLSSNLGKKPVRLVFSEEGTTFGAIGFDVDGTHLTYAAQHADHHAEVHSIDLADTTKAPVVWSGPVGSTVLDIRPGLVSGTVAWTTGTSCDDSTAMAHTPAGNVTVMPDVVRPTRAVGWLSATQLLVAIGACSGPLDIAAVDVSIGSIAPLVSGVDDAAVRTAVPTPPAPVPKAVLSQGSGFS